MAGEWLHSTLGEFVSLQRGHDLTEPERKRGTVPVMGSAGQNGFHDTALAKGPGIVIGRSGASFGQVHYCPVDYWPHNTTLYVTDFHGNDPQFAYYFLKNINFARYNSGSAQPSLNRNFIYPIEVNVPQFDEQRAIAHILGTLDDKIELNRRMNETLEAIARAIFKSWFVDFDPIRAKASGEPPDSICRRLRLTPDLLALFPDRLVDSELGEIPEGWEVKPLDGIADYLNGLALQKFPPENDSEWLPVIKISQLKKGDSVGADRASHKLKPEYIVDDGDVLFSWSGSLEVDIWCGGRGALNQHLFKVTSTKYPKWFFFYWTKYHLSHFQAIAAGKAVTMGHIQRKHLTEALCAVPPKPLMEKFDDIIASLLDKQIENRKEARTLGLVRDTILPKLLSGELHVPVAGAA